MKSIPGENFHTLYISDNLAEEKNAHFALERVVHPDINFVLKIPLPQNAPFGASKNESFFRSFFDVQNQTRCLQHEILQLQI